MKIQENTEETQGTYSKCVYENPFEGRNMSKSYFAEKSIEMKAREILKDMATETFHQIRVAVQKPDMVHNGVFEKLYYPRFVDQNYYVVHFNKMKLRTGKTIWTFDKIEY